MHRPFRVASALVAAVSLGACAAPSTTSRTVTSLQPIGTGRSAAARPVAVTGRPRANRSPCPSVLCVIDNAFPKATISYGRHQSGAAGPLTLDIRLPKSSPPPTGTADQRTWVYLDTGWRAELAFAAAHLLDKRIGAYRLAYANGAKPSGADSNSLHGGISSPIRGVRPIPLPKIDSISLRLALRQMRSNLKVLDETLGRGAVTSQQIHVVDLDAARGRFGLNAAVELSNPDALHNHLSDLIDGLTAGFGLGASSLIEGLGITATADGRPLAGAWSSARMSDGSVYVADGIHYPGDNGTLAHFPDLTGGPKAIPSAPGGAGAT